jgi:hypothetical protein
MNDAGRLPTTLPSTGDRLRRIWRHVRFTRGAARRAFPPATLGAIEQAIAEGERSHRGEVRVIVERSWPWSAIWDGTTPRQRALALFAEHGIWDTADRSGVLLYISLADHKVEIVADRGINRLIEHTTWQAICSRLTQGYAAGEFHQSTLDAVAAVNALLHQHFPAGDGNHNELPDRPLVL